MKTKASAGNHPNGKHVGETNVSTRPASLVRPTPSVWPSRQATCMADIQPNQKREGGSAPHRQGKQVALASGIEHPRIYAKRIGVNSRIRKRVGHSQSTHYASNRPAPKTTTLTAVRVPKRPPYSGGSFFLRPFGAERTPSEILGGSGNRSADQPISQARIIAASDLPCICALTWACFFNLRVTGISILSSLRSSPAPTLAPVPVSFGKPENRCVTAQKYTPCPDTSIFIRMNCNTPWWNFALGRNIDRRWRTADGLDRLQSYFTRPKNHFGLAFAEAAFLRLGAAFTPSEILGGSGNSSSDHPITQARIIAASERPCIWALAWAFFFILLETGTTILSSLTSSSSSSAGELGGYRCGTAASIRDNILIYAKAFQCIRMNSNVWE